MIWFISAHPSGLQVLLINDKLKLTWLQVYKKSLKLWCMRTVCLPRLSSLKLKRSERKQKHYLDKVSQMNTFDLRLSSKADLAKGLFSTQRGSSKLGLNLHGSASECFSGGFLWSNRKETTVKTILFFKYMALIETQSLHFNRLVHARRPASSSGRWPSFCRHFIFTHLYNRWIQSHHGTNIKSLNL